MQNDPEMSIHIIFVFNFDVITKALSLTVLRGPSEAFTALQILYFVTTEEISFALKALSLSLGLFDLVPFFGRPFCPCKVTTFLGVDLPFPWPATLYKKAAATPFDLLHIGVPPPPPPTHPSPNR